MKRYRVARINASWEKKSLERKLYFFPLFLSFVSLLFCRKKEFFPSLVCQSVDLTNHRIILIKLKFLSFRSNRNFFPFSRIKIKIIQSKKFTSSYPASYRKNKSKLKYIYIYKDQISFLLNFSKILLDLDRNPPNFTLLTSKFTRRTLVLALKPSPLRTTLDHHSTFPFPHSTPNGQPPFNQCLLGNFLEILRGMNEQLSLDPLFRSQAGFSRGSPWKKGEGSIDKRRAKEQRNLPDSRCYLP